MVKFSAFRVTLYRLIARVGAILMFAFSTPVAAQEYDVSFCYNDWPPYVSTKKGVAKGISVDVTREAAKRAGLSVSFQELPWNRCLEMVRQGEIDGVMDAAERPEFLQGPASFSAYTNTVWVHENSVLQQFEFSALEGKTIGLVSGYSYPQDLLDNLKQVDVKIDYAVDDETNIRKLAFGRVEAIVADFANTLEIARVKHLGIRPLTPTHSRDLLYLSLNPNRMAAHKALNAAIEEMLSDGVIEQIYRDHLSVGLSELVGE